MVPDHGFARVGTMQVQAIMPSLILRQGGWEITSDFWVRDGHLGHF